MQRVIEEVIAAGEEADSDSGAGAGSAGVMPSPHCDTRSDRQHRDVAEAPGRRESKGMGSQHSDVEVEMATKTFPTEQ